MIDHIGIGVRDYARSQEFYKRALAPLGYAVVKELAFGDERFTGLGVGGRPDFWIEADPEAKREAVHIAFACKDRGEVDAFHAAALAAGGRDNGKPGPRAEYHPGYYGAFVLDPDGNNIEAVCHRAPA
jgi:catechol 2,3-dioxygenase-like lactoylglutathione lyase family enzyme